MALLSLNLDRKKLERLKKKLHTRRDDVVITKALGLLDLALEKADDKGVIKIGEGENSVFVALR